MSLKKPKRVQVIITELLKAKKGKSGKSIPNKGRSKSFTVYGATVDEVYDKLIAALQES